MFWSPGYYGSSTGDGATSGLREPATKSSEDINISGSGRQGKGAVAK